MCHLGFKKFDIVKKLYLSIIGGDNGGEWGSLGGNLGVCEKKLVSGRFLNSQAAIFLSFDVFLVELDGDC